MSLAQEVRVVGLWMVWLGCGGRPPVAGSAEPPAAEVVDRVLGTWTGELSLGGQTLRLAVHLSRADDGTFSGTMDSPDQGATGLAVSSVVVTSDGLSFRVPSVGGSYEGTWTEAGTLTGRWSQGLAAMDLDLARGEAPAPPQRPQDPVPPLPYDAIDVTFDSLPTVTLAGTLTRPRTAGPHPAVVLISGSGPQDRDSAIMGHRPFLILADALTRAGVAVLRYDDRGVGASTGDFETATTLDFAADAQAAVRFLAGRDDVRSDRIGLVGHSEGGLIAPLAAGEVAVAFVGLLAGPALPGRTVIEGQVEAANRAVGATEAQAKAARDQQARLMQLVVSNADEAVLRAAMVEAGVPESTIDVQLAQLTSPWYRTFLTLDPVPALRALDVPVLALFGENDLQVLPSEHVAPMKEALAANGEATIEVLPGLNHLFQPATTGMPTEYPQIETTIDPVALDRITAFVKAQGARP